MTSTILRPLGFQGLNSPIGDIAVLQLLSDLTVFSLTNPRLRQITVSGRTTSLTEDELIHSPPSEYPNIRTWARFLHQVCPRFKDSPGGRDLGAGDGPTFFLPTDAARML